MGGHRMPINFAVKGPFRSPVSFKHLVKTKTQVQCSSNAYHSSLILSANQRKRLPVVCQEPIFCAFSFSSLLDALGEPPESRSKDINKFGHDTRRQPRRVACTLAVAWL